MALTHLTSMNDLRDQIERIFADFTEETRFPIPFRQELPVFRGNWLPPIELSETEKELTLCAALPGLKPEEIHLEVVGNTLVLSGEYRREQKREEKHLHRSELQYGNFLRRIPLPEYVKGENAVAEFKHGMLELHLPKTEEAKRKRIEVKGK